MEWRDELVQAVSNANLEETPVIDEPEEDIYTTGNTRTCYACSIDFSRFPDPGQAMIRKDYERKANPKRGVTAARYFLTLCYWCDHHHRNLKPGWQVG